MFETINNWIVTYMETPHYQRTIECECLFFLAIAIYSVIVIAAIFLVWIIAKWFKKFVDKAAEREAKYKEEDKR
jgi:hypothetical protein